MNHETWDWYWDCMKNGRFIPRTSEQIVEVIGEYHLRGEAITEPSEEDMPLVAESIGYQLEFMYKRDKEKASLVNQDLIFVPKEELEKASLDKFPKIGAFVLESSRENMDLILSNYAFCYFANPAAVLENCLQSLSIGGEAHLSVSPTKQRFFVPNFAQKLRDQYDRLQRLSDDGFIELYVKSGRYGEHALKYEPEPDNQTYFPSAWVEMKKLRSLED